MNRGQKLALALVAITAFAIGVAMYQSRNNPGGDIDPAKHGGAM